MATTFRITVAVTVLSLRRFNTLYKKSASNLAMLHLYTRCIGYQKTHLQTGMPNHSVEMELSGKNVPTTADTFFIQYIQRRRNQRQRIILIVMSRPRNLGSIAIGLSKNRFSGVPPPKCKVSNHCLAMEERSASKARQLKHASTRPHTTPILSSHCSIVHNIANVHSHS